MSLPVLSVQLAAWAQEELEAQRGYLTLLQRQERAVRRASRPELLEALEGLERSLGSRAIREKRRTALLERLGQAFGVSAASLTLGSVAERLEARGIDAASLRARREELRGVVAEVANTGRRLAALSKYHQGLLGEVIRTLAGTDESQGIEEGALLDARG